MNEYTVIACVSGLLAGLGVMWFYNRKNLNQFSSQINDLERRLAVENERLNGKSQQIDECKSRLKEYEDANYSARVAELETLLENEKRLNWEKIALLEQAEKNMTAAFENLANRIIEEKSQKFTEQNKLNIDGVLKPLREQLGDFRKKIEDVYDKESKDRMSLFHEINGLKSLNVQMSKDAINLTKALKGDSKTRGNWGEVILERVLEDSGLKNGREYEAQGNFRDKNGDLFKPDVIVHLPNNKDVIIDSKVSLNAYERYSSTEDDAERKQALEEHLNSIRVHVSGLQGKNYADLLGVNSLDIVLMFVPIEPALMLAIEHDKNLFQDAFKSGIYLVSPFNLTMNLQIIHNMWRHEYQNRNAQEIAKKAGDMYDKFVGFVEALEDIGDKLGKAQSAYQTAHNRLTTGKGNLIKKAEDMRKLGLEPDKKLSKELTDKTINDDETPGITKLSE